MSIAYNSFNHYLRHKFGLRVQKLPLDAGFGCPNRDGTVGTGGCIFCGDRGSASPVLDVVPRFIGEKKECSTLFSPINRPVPGEETTLIQQIAKAKQAMRKRYGACKYIVYFQAYTNTYAPVETLRRVYDQALAYMGDEAVGLAVGTRPDCLPEDVLDLLQEYNRRYEFWLEIGLQSAHDRTLRLINRGHTAAQFEDAIRRAKSRGIKVCAHVILGLPGETKADMLETACFLSRLGVDGVKLHALYILPGTTLAQLYAEGKYRPLTMEEYVDLVCDFLKILPPDIIVHRLCSDPPKNFLAPQWLRDKSEAIQKIVKGEE